MKVFAIDPGTRVLGFAALDDDAGRIRVVEAGEIRLGGGDLPGRLRKAFEGLSEAIRRNAPGEIAIEEVHYGKSVRSAITSGEGRGVALLAAALADIPIFPYSPTAVKKAVTGSGGAHKSQVDYMVRKITGYAGELSEDAADALAIALCHCHQRKFRALVASAENRVAGRPGGL